MNKKEIVLTGDRPTGPLHLGHYIGSLANRVRLQELYKQYILIADVQALTDNYEHPEKVRDNILQVALDYLAVGIDPKKSTIFIQSMIPQIAELTIYYMNLVTLTRLKRNPTVKTEIKQKGFEESVPVGFLVYPISQAADITIVKGNIVPVGEDQLPVLEQANEIVRSFNSIYKAEVFPEIKPILSETPRLLGIDGKAKMSKSLGNAIYLSDSKEVLYKKVMSMYTDPGHIRVQDPGKIEGNTVFNYLDTFDLDKARVGEFKAHYERGGLGDVVVKKHLFEVLDNLLEPIRTRRQEFAKDPKAVMQILIDGTNETLKVASNTMVDVKKAMLLNYY